MMIQIWIEICRVRIKLSKQLDRKLSGNCSDGKLNKNKCSSESFETQQEIRYQQAFFVLHLS